jgi:hypothetical protein
LRAEELVERWRALPQVDPDQLKRDLDAFMEPAL